MPPKKSAKSTSKPKNSKSTKRKAPQAFSPRQKEIFGLSIIAIAIVLVVSMLLAPTDGAEATGIGIVPVLLLRLLSFLAAQAAVILPFFLLVLLKHKFSVTDAVRPKQCKVLIM